MVAKAGFPGATMGPGVRTLLTDFVARGKVACYHHGVMAPPT